MRLELTAEGEALLRRDPLKELEEVVAGSLQEAAHEDLVASLGKVVDRLQRACGVGTFGVCRECCMFCLDGATALPGGPHRCGFNGEPIDDREADRLCVNFRRAS